MKIERRIIKISGVAAGLLLLAGTVFAQDLVATAESTLTTDRATLLELLITGGWAMIPLGILSFGMFVFVVQNALSLQRKRLLHSEMMPVLLEMMLNRQVKEALVYCRQNPTLFTNSFGAGLERVVDGVTDMSQVDASVREATVEQVTSLMKPIDYLSIIGATSPMLGLLGTVSGMIKAFQTMGTQGMGKPELLAANIGEALITTATGLVIAIPAMFFFFAFKKSFGKTMASLGRNVGYLFDALESGRQPASFMEIEDLNKIETDFTALFQSKHGTE